MAGEFQLTGKNAKALFTLKVYRGDGMALLAMNWKDGKPPPDFVGFAIEYKEPNGNRFFALKNRINFLSLDGKVNRQRRSTLESPIQMFRWVHFPRNAELTGEFTYRVSPVFMNDLDELSYGDPQTVAIELARETYPGQLNVCFTRGFVSSQAFVDRYESAGPISKLLPKTAAKGLEFEPKHPKTKEALEWMGFEARHAILEVLDQAIADKNAQVRVIAYDLNQPEIVSRLEQLGPRLKIIIDDSKEHGKSGSAETKAAKRLSDSAGAENVKRQHMSSLQHNKTIVVDGPAVKKVVCGSTNFSWRGFFVQSNNAVILRGSEAILPFLAAFDSYWDSDKPSDFGKTPSAGWTNLGLSGIDASVTFSPHSAENAMLSKIADDVTLHTESSLFYSLAFLSSTDEAFRQSITDMTEENTIFVYGVADKKVGGIELQKPNGNIAPLFPAQLAEKNLPEPFSAEPAGGGGTRMHHKFIVIDFNKPTARVYLGSYNFSGAADSSNGENLLLIRDRRIAVSYAIEAIRIFDHYHFRIKQLESKQAKEKLALAKPPRKPDETAWWQVFYSEPHKIRDRELFA